MYEYDDGTKAGRSPVRILVTVLVIAASGGGRLVRRQATPDRQ